MFGYVLPQKNELKVREWEDYRAVYCGLCHTLGRRYGFFTRFLLNYDFAFLAMLLTGPGDKPEAVRRRCAALPVRGCMACAAREGLDIAADESVILTWWKLQDNIQDAPPLKRLAARGLSLIWGRAYRKAAGLRPEFDQTVSRCLAQLRALEEARSPSLDRTADTFARILSSAAPAGDRAVEQLLYHVGRWIYLVDAWDDLAEDAASDGYNPVALRWPDGPEGHREELRSTLRHSLNLALSACNLSDFGPYHPIVLNILCLGLPSVEEAVFTGQWRELKKQSGRSKHERSV